MPIGPIRDNFRWAQGCASWPTSQGFSEKMKRIYLCSTNLNCNKDSVVRCHECRERVPTWPVFFLPAVTVVSLRPSDRLTPCSRPSQWCCKVAPREQSRPRPLACRCHPHSASFVATLIPSPLAEPVWLACRPDDGVNPWDQGALHIYPTWP